MQVSTISYLHLCMYVCMHVSLSLSLSLSLCVCVWVGGVYPLLFVFGKENMNGVFMSKY